MKQIVKFWDKIIVVLLGVLGLLSCEKSKPMYSVEPELYGMPPVSYCELKGIITDKETAKPIQNIQVIGQYSDTIYTDAEGRYIFRRDMLPEFHLKIEDIDGEANNGEFETQEMDVKFANDEYVKTVNIELETKK